MCRKMTAQLTGLRNFPKYRRFWTTNKHGAINSFWREIGLGVQKGNPNQVLNLGVPKSLDQFLRYFQEFDF